MKRSCITLLGIILLIIAVLLGLTACHLFFLPDLPRTNPYDENAVVAPVENLSAIPTSDGTIQLSWNTPAERQPVSLIILVNSLQLPANLNDGRRYDLDNPSAGTWTDAETSEGATYYYGVWSVSEDNTEVGPIYTESGLRRKSVSFTPETDGQVDDMATTNFVNPTIQVANTAGHYYGVLLFPLPSDIATIISSDLTITTSMMTGGDHTLAVHRILEDWNTSLNYSTVTSGSFFEDLGTDSPTMLVANTDPADTAITTSVASLLQTMADEGSNNGILLRMITATVQPFHSMENGTDDDYIPRLTIEYYSSDY